jgi:hypothetical protein
VLPNIPIQNLANFRQRGSHQIELQNLCWFWNLEKELVAGPACQWPMLAHSRVSRPTRTRECSGGVVTACHLTPAQSAARHASSTRRSCGHRPVCPYLTLLWSKGEAPPYLDSSSPQCSSTPLPLTTSLSSENFQAPAPYAPPPASSSPSRASPRPEVPHQPLLSHRRAPLRPLTGALPSAEFTTAVSPHR